MDESFQNNDIIIFKIVIIGDTATGKTSFILRFVENTFGEEVALSTIGIDQKKKFVKFGDKKIELQIWDTAGQERYRSLTHTSFKGADGAIFMYDISNIKTFQNLKRWMFELNEQVNINKMGIVIVGNKCDIPDEEKCVKQKAKEKFQKAHHYKIIEASAKTNKNVAETFTYLIEQMLKLGLNEKIPPDRTKTNSQIYKISKKKDNDQNNNKKGCC